MTNILLIALAFFGGLFCGIAEASAFEGDPAAAAGWIAYAVAIIGSIFWNDAR